MLVEGTNSEQYKKVLGFCEVSLGGTRCGLAVAGHGFMVPVVSGSLLGGHFAEC